MSRPWFRQRALVLDDGTLALQEGVAHLVDVGGDHDAQARTLRAILADGDDGGTVPCPLGAEVVAGELAASSLSPADSLPMVIG